MFTDSKGASTAPQISLATARELASAHPQAMIPCPLCGGSVRAQNLESHLGKTHPGVPLVGVSSSTVWSCTGTDRLMAVPVLGLAGVWCGLLGLWSVLRIGLVITHWVPIGLLLGTVTLLIATELNAFQATLSVHSDSVVLRYALGLLERRIRFPVLVELGGLRRRQRQPVPGALAIEAISMRMPHVVPAGVYLRLIAGRRTVTIGCSSGGNDRKHWIGWTAGKPRMKKDIVLDRATFVQLQYALLRAQILQCRPQNELSPEVCRPNPDLL